MNKLSSTYSEKIKELRSTAQETQAAIKIQDKLNELRSKDVVISSYRWIWELIQNAKDCTNSTGKIDIEIYFDSKQKIVEFKHNGKLFATKNIVYLIEQVSTKERSRNSASTGKFGTGFLTTNLLSPIITISGLLHDEDESNIARFQVTIDRSGKCLDELKEAIKNSCDQLEANTFNITDAVDENAMNTMFSYSLDENGVNVAKVGLENFLITAPYVFAFVSELNKITVTADGIETVYTRDKVGITQSDNTFVSRIRKNNSPDIINIFTIQSDTLMLAAEIKNINGGMKEGGVIGGVKEAGKSVARVGTGMLGMALGTALIPVPVVGSIVGYMAGDWIAKLVVGKNYTERQLEAEVQASAQKETTGATQQTTGSVFDTGTTNPFAAGTAMTPQEIMKLQMLLQSGYGLDNDFLGQTISYKN